MRPTQPEYDASSLLWFVIVRVPTLAVRVETMRANVGFCMA